MKSGTMERNFGGAGDRESFCRRYRLDYGRILAVSMFLRLAGQ
jgi:hypothetical protein